MKTIELPTCVLAFWLGALAFIGYIVGVYVGGIC